MKKISLCFSALALVVAALLLWAAVPQAQQSSAPAKKVRLGYLRSDLHHLAAWVALEKGFFAAEGLAVEVAGIFNAGPEQMSAFASRSIDMGYLGMAPSTTGVANKAAQVTAVSLANAEGSSLVVRKDSPVQEVRDLAGKTVAIPGYATVQDFLLRKALERAGLDAKSVTIIAIKPPEMLPALATKQIDAFIAWEPHPSKAVTNGSGRVLLSSSQIWKGHPCCIVAAESAFYKNNPSVVKAFVRAHANATEFIKKNPEEALKIGRKYTGMDEATVRTAMSHILYSTEINERDVKEYLQYLTKFGYIKAVDVDALSRDYLDADAPRSGTK